MDLETTVKKSCCNEGSRTDQGSNDKEMNLQAIQQGFKGKCDNCNQWGHKAVNCPQKNNSDQGSGNNYNKRKETRTCDFCNKKGHVKINCWKNPDGKNHKPKKCGAATSNKASLCS